VSKPLHEVGWLLGSLVDVMALKNDAIHGQLIQVRGRRFRVVVLNVIVAVVISLACSRRCQRQELLAAAAAASSSGSSGSGSAAAHSASTQALQTFVNPPA